MRPLFVFLLLCTSTFAQINLVEQQTQVWSGFDAPVVREGRVYTGPFSKPRLERTDVEVVVHQVVPYEFLQVQAERIPTLESIELSEVDGTLNTWKFPADTVAGKYRVAAIAFDPKKGIATKRLDVTIGKPAPDPDPDPDPDPKPPEPTPDLPIAGQGLRVMIVYEQDEAAKYPLTQSSQFTSLVLRQFLNEVCAKDSKGNSENRVLDQDAIDVPGTSTVWSAALKRKRDSLPWIVIANGKAGYEGPLPLTMQETRTLIERFKPLPTGK